jgi:hypothetical protein
MAAAGAAGDDLRLGIAHAQYEAWLTDQGYRPDHATGNHAPERGMAMTDDTEPEAKPDPNQAFGVEGGDMLWRMILESFVRTAK